MEILESRKKPLRMIKPIHCPCNYGVLYTDRSVELLNLTSLRWHSF